MAFSSFSRLMDFCSVRPIRQRSAQPAVVHEKTPAALRLFGDRFLGLPLGAYK